MMRTYQFKLEPNKAQIEKIEWTLSMCRWLYNAMLEQRKFAYEKRSQTVNYSKQANELPLLKKAIPEFKQIQSQVLQHVARRLDRAFQSFFRRIWKGQTPGYPRFQGKRRFDSFTYPQSGYQIEGKHLRLSKIGKVRIKLHRHIEGKVKTCTIKRKNGKYYACLSCEFAPHSLPPTGKQVGVDLGVTHLAITSD
ncbi:transposase, partial [Hazenella sp. IB182357]